MIENLATLFGAILIVVCALLVALTSYSTSMDLTKKPEEISQQCQQEIEDRDNEIFSAQKKALTGALVWAVIIIVVGGILLVVFRNQMSQSGTNAKKYYSPENPSALWKYRMEQQQQMYDNNAMM